VGDSFGVLVVVAIAIGLVLLALRRRRLGPSDPEAAIQAAIVDAERDRQRTAALEATDHARHQIPPGMF
jgi:hypothetical protein